MAHSTTRKPEAPKKPLLKISEEIFDLDVFMAFDYSQVEVRMLAEVSGDPLLISQFTSGMDIHCQVGHMLTGWSVERIAQEKNTRKLVKNMIFGIIYGLGRENLYDYIVGKIRANDGEAADLTGITPSRIVKLYDRFFQIYKGVRAYIEKYRRMAEETGSVPTLFGFNREIRPDDESRGTYWLNQAINTPLQGSAHQLVLMAIALLHMKPRTYNHLQRPSMEVHDALYFFVKLRNLVAAFHQGKLLFETSVVQYAQTHFQRTLRVPLIAEAEAGFCLGSLVDYSGQPIEEFLPAWREKHKAVESKSWKELLETSEYGVIPVGVPV